jgi:hypothetical protein
MQAKIDADEAKSRARDVLFSLLQVIITKRLLCVLPFEAITNSNLTRQKSIHVSTQTLR